MPWYASSLTAQSLAQSFHSRFVQFPPLPAKVLEMDDVSAYDVAAANLELAIDFSKNLCQDGKKVAILFPDEAELEIATEKLGRSTLSWYHRE